MIHLTNSPIQNFKLLIFVDNIDFVIKRDDFTQNVSSLSFLDRMSDTLTIVSEILIFTRNGPTVYSQSGRVTPPQALDFQ